MKIVRPVRHTDFEGLYSCSVTSGLGLTHLPKNPDAIRDKISHSLDSFAKEVHTPEDEEYLFVMVDHATNIVEGTCAIFARTGAKTPSCFFEVGHLPPLPLGWKRGEETRILHRKIYHGGPTEIGGLYLLPGARRSGHGKLLSLSRFLFIASHRNRYTDVVIANMRGMIENNRSPFWDGVGRKFLEMEFEEMMLLRAKNDVALSNILPDFPLPVSLLSIEAKNALGNVHSNTKSAYQMLSNEGFMFANEVDPFDGGPVLAAPTNQIRTVRESILSSIKEVSIRPLSSAPVLLSNHRLDFFSCLASINFNQNQIVIDKETSEALELQKGDEVIYSVLI